MMRLLRLQKFKEESGAVLVMVAIFMVVLLGFIAITIDGGRLYSEKSKLQKALDAAVLSGAQELKTSQAMATSNAKDVSQKNGVTLMDAHLTFTSSSIKATKQINVPLTFARVLGFKNTNVSATAKAIVAPLKKASGVAPIAVDKNSVPDSLVLNCGQSNPGKNHGNCGYIDLNGSGANGLADAIVNGSTFDVGSKIVETEPGGKQGPVNDAIQSLIDSDASKSYCQSAATADNSCKRVITVVVIDTWADANGKSNLTIVGLAAYWIEKYQNKTLYGQFIKMVSPGEIGSETAIGDYNLYGVKLAE
ncbi:TadE/TadG family type IV pilus assembly protein [Neobacillus bataviensis]|uniref:TadE/TadG family type IV pilus assembly protein n=1 Tax=Neobacillus bataviensis TaxID=220685 RepID=UPI001CBFB174|nr:Tad domain-containing protein [Neobacillus bataviensis]